MKEQSEIEALIKDLELNCPNIIISQVTNFDEKPFEFGVWKFWLENFEENYVQIEVQRGECYAVYASIEFNDKYPISATKICNFLNKFH